MTPDVVVAGSYKSLLRVWLCFAVQPPLGLGVCEEWVDYTPGEVPDEVAPDAIRYQLVTFNPAELRDICDRTDSGVRCGPSLRARP